MLPELGVTKANGLLSIGMIYTNDWVFHVFLTHDTLVVGWPQFPSMELEKRIWLEVGNTVHDAQVYVKNQWTNLDEPAQEALFNPACLGVGLL